MAQTLDILERLVGFDTVSAKSNLELIAYIEAYLKERGFRTTRFPDATGTKAGLYAEIGPAGAGVLLSGHTDVVPIAGQAWSRDPFSLWVEGDRLFGRGTTDMKGYVACMLSAADRAAHLALKEPLRLVLSYDEEVGCVGIQHMIGPLASRVGTPRACFVGEPTGMQVAVGHKGKTALKAVCHGQAGHSAMAPKFVNALHLAAEFVVDLREVQQWLAASGARDDAYDIPYSTIHVGKLNGGSALNIVPDRAELDLEVRHLAEDPAEALVTRIAAAADAVAARYRGQWSGVSIEVDQYNAYPGLDVPKDAAVIRLAQSLSRSDATIKVPFGTEAGFFAALSIPTVVCGPGSMEGQGHKPDEYVTKGQIAACERMMENILKELC